MRHKNNYFLTRYPGAWLQQKHVLQCIPNHFFKMKVTCTVSEGRPWKNNCFTQRAVPGLQSWKKHVLNTTMLRQRFNKHTFYTFPKEENSQCDDTSRQKLEESLAPRWAQPTCPHIWREQHHNHADTTSVTTCLPETRLYFKRSRTRATTCSVITTAKH